jgi:hypothetical protein
MVPPFLDSLGQGDKQMTHRISISTILLGVAVASAHAQIPAATSQDANLRYTAPQMIVLIQSCAPQAAPSTMFAVARTESALHPYAISINRPKQVSRAAGLSNLEIQLARQPRSKQEAVQWMRWLLNHGITVSVGLLQVTCAPNNFLSHAPISLSAAHFSHKPMRLKSALLRMIQMRFCARCRATTAEPTILDLTTATSPLC